MSNNLPNLPKSVLGFCTEMEPYSQGVCVKDGKVVIKLKDSVWQTPDSFVLFVRFTNAAKAKFQIGIYTDQVCESVPKKPFAWVTAINLQVDVKTMLLDRLRCFFSPESEFSVADSINFLLNHGLSDIELQSRLNIPKTTFFRYKNQRSKMEQPQKTELATIPNVLLN
jgi:hypothetical protein